MFLNVSLNRFLESKPFRFPKLKLDTRGKVLAKPEKVKWRKQVDDDVSFIDQYNIKIL